MDTLVFKDLVKADISITKDKSHLYINIKNTNSTIKVYDHYTWKFGYHNQLNKIEFADGSTIDENGLELLVRASENYEIS